MECSYSLKNIDQPCVSKKDNHRNKQGLNENQNRNQQNECSGTLSCPKSEKSPSRNETNAIGSAGENSQSTASSRKTRVKRDAASQDNGKIYIVRRFVQFGR